MQRYVMVATTHASIAVVEDDDGVRTALQQLLRAAAFEVVAFASAEEFLAANGGCHVDCVIADVNLPGMSGVALLRALAANGGAGLPAVLITGRDDPATLALIRRAGRVTCLQKPCGDDELFCAIRAALRG